MHTCNLFICKGFICKQHRHKVRKADSSPRLFSQAARTTDIDQRASMQKPLTRTKLMYMTPSRSLVEWGPDVRMRGRPRQLHIACILHLHGRLAWQPLGLGLHQ